MPSQQASQAIYAYLEARTKENVDKMVQLSCAAWEEQAHIEAVSFRGRQARLQDATCADNGSDGEFTLVLCQGKIMTNYGGESRELDLSHRQFKTIFDHGEWRMCGYK
ncbi:MAG: hypothetical protein M1546_19330 [Chloroflexi bacterium]|nr:hypothetical protein [Chloroflexota bacterium]